MLELPHSQAKMMSLHIHTNLEANEFIDMVLMQAKAEYAVEKSLDAMEGKVLSNSSTRQMKLGCLLWRIYVCKLFSSFYSVIHTLLIS